MRPTKRLAQHFLVDRGVLESILRAAALTPQDVVVEIGPGLGLMTELLATRVARLIAVELDSTLARALTRLFAPYPSTTIVEGDARTVDLSPWLPPALPYKVVANLPYYAAVPIIRRFLEDGHRPTLMVVMLQKEVALQMCAPPGRMTLLSVGIQVYAHPRLVRVVPARCFYPPPRVASAVVRLEVYPQPRVPSAHLAGFFALVRLGFQAHRKQLGGHLRRSLNLPGERVERAFSTASIPLAARPEALSIPQWESLYHALQEEGWTPSA
ncbi:MAG: 16S rRNA (adenine(1518)-N(6)/adenine(1519)-N(6))-dimethyltransferase RsmA [Dehalococcoidia bacterium]|nr:16S rRNA (adenine(1518)-N(6)/adenine(1519)-N(6))-dimethyltransferase RsmA [Dehalococcoidia bacterium]